METSTRIASPQPRPRLTPAHLTPPSPIDCLWSSTGLSRSGLVTFSIPLLLSLCASLLDGAIAAPGRVTDVRTLLTGEIADPLTGGIAKTPRFKSEILTGATTVGVTRSGSSLGKIAASNQAQRWVEQSRSGDRAAGSSEISSTTASGRNQSPSRGSSGGIQRPNRLRFDPRRAVFTVPPDFSNRTLPSPEEVRTLQEKLQNPALLPKASPTSSIQRTVYPGVTISNPSGYGADRGQLFAGASFQSRTRFSGGPNPRTIFGGGVRDGTLGFGIGLGDARESVGLQASYTIASFGGSRAPLSGGINAKIHAQFGRGWAAAIGGEGIRNFGRLPVNNGNGTTFNDFEQTYYGVVTHSIPLQDNINGPFSRLTLTAGLGSGRFRDVKQIFRGESAVGFFGSAALQVLPSTSVISEWTGQDLAVGLSIAPFPKLPLTLNPAIRDIAGTSDGKPRFIFSIGGSSTLNQIFSLVKSLF